MAALNELIQKIENPELRAQIQAAADKLVKQKKFGLVFEEHLPECTPLYDIPVRKGLKVSLRGGKVNETYTVLKIEGGKALCLPRNGNEAVEFPVADLVTTAELGDPIYPCLQMLDEVCNAPDSDLWHTLIEADNYHALQLLEYLYAGKVDCIYIDPPYNKVNSRDWKYNCNYVDGNDSYRHSKWLSMMQKRLEIAKRLLNPNDSVLIVTIDEKEYLHLGCLLEEMFPQARIQMITTCINPNGAARNKLFTRVDEYIFFVMLGECAPVPTSRNMLDKEVRSTESVTWFSLIRTGSNSLRAHSENCFYPIFINNKTGKIDMIGEPVGKGISKNTITPREGCTIVWPMHGNGDEGVWQMGVDELTRRKEAGAVRVSKKKGKFVLTYLRQGQLKEIEDGKVAIVGYDRNGTMILKRVEDQLVQARTMWNQASHDATTFGSKLIKQIISNNEFKYPKSLYAVQDTLSFFVANKLEAIIIDFFAGSGTTLHAVNLLNAEDGGHRRCIMVTNNEISEAEQKDFEARGIKQGDPEWESRGIARYVTWPRTVCSIKGQNIFGKPLPGDYGITEEEYVLDEECTIVSKSTGKPVKKNIYVKKKVQKAPALAEIKKADGFKANAVFFKLGFLDKTKVSLGMQFKELLSILWMKAGAIGRCPSIDAGVPDMLILPENKMAILNDENRFGAFAEKLAQHPEIEVVYLVTDYESSFVSMTQALEGKTTYQLYRDYLDNFRINAGRNSR